MTIYSVFMLNIFLHHLDTSLQISADLYTKVVLIYSVIFFYNPFDPTGVIRSYGQEKEVR